MAFRFGGLFRHAKITKHHLTPEGVPGDKSDYGENNARIFSTIDDETRVIPAVEFRHVNFAYKMRDEKEAQEAVSSAEKVLTSAGLTAIGVVLSGNVR